MKIGIIGDIHEDIVDLKKALILIEKTGCDEIICTGDIIGFGYPNFGFFDTRNASGCIQAVSSHCTHTVAGNHDMSSIGRIPEFTAGFQYPDDWYRMAYRKKKKLAEDHVWLPEENEFDPLIGPDEVRFLHSLPEYKLLEYDDLRILFSHYFFPDLSGSSKRHYLAFEELPSHFRFMKKNKCTLGISGHVHPEGMLFATENKWDYMGFGETSFEIVPIWISIPCIANGAKENGFAILDTDRLTIEAIPLGTPKRIMTTVCV